MRSKTAQDSCLAWILQNRFHQLLWHRRGSAVVWLSHMAKVYRGLPGTNKTSEGFVNFDILIFLENVNKTVSILIYCFC